VTPPKPAAELLAAQLAALLARYGPLPDLPDAACRGRDPMFDDKLPGESAEAQRARWDAALAVCRGCPAQARCRDLLDAPGARWPGVGVMAGRVLAVQPGHHRHAA
jgi:hypothetical protein